MNPRSAEGYRVTIPLNAGRLYSPVAAVAPENILVRPSAPAWRAALSRDGATAKTQESREFRRELGLPTDRPIVMSGHQPTLWHPGILAKWLAMDQAAGQLGAHAAWLVVDHDEVSPLTVRVPTRNKAGVLTAREFDLGLPQSLAHAPASTRPASPVREPTLPEGESLAMKSVGDGLGSIVRACNQFAGARSAAEQAARATSHLIHSGGIASAAEPTLIFATALDQTTAFKNLLARLAADPLACINAYNAAARRHPQAGIRELDASTNDVELPLWIMHGGTRRSARTSDLAQASTVRLAPKALLMTLLLRLHACDLFIHGLGGGGEHEGAGYDEVMQDWASEWLGPVALAPMATVTATLRLPFEGEAPVSMEAAQHARWSAWHARNEPAVLGDDSLSREKRALAHAIAQQPRHDPKRRSTFREMRGMVAAFQNANAASLASLHENALTLQARAAADEIRLDRTWPFPLYPAESLSTLRLDLQAVLSLGGGPAS